MLAHNTISVGIAMILIGQRIESRPVAVAVSRVDTEDARAPGWIGKAGIGAVIRSSGKDKHARIDSGFEFQFDRWDPAPEAEREVDYGTAPG